MHQAPQHSSRLLLVADERALGAVAGVLRSTPSDLRGAAFLEVAHPAPRRSRGNPTACGCTGSRARTIRSGAWLRMRCARPNFPPRGPCLRRRRAETRRGPAPSGHRARNRDGRCDFHRLPASRQGAGLNSLGTEFVRRPNHDPAAERRTSYSA
ncbi:SIP domain-containing protein [Nocardia sp. NEAU-G5]|uniref:SIP domain-containing protein n=1 Tax=Nocardia albiluteola TaxID=2842303 RepID=A0ABS6AS51_9NOCA|nr:SIP domain-containing protein [Nocardia albiluteola]